MSAEDEIESLLDRTEGAYALANTTIKRADVLGRAAVSGLVILARQIDAIPERVAGIASEIGEDSVDVHAELADLRKQIKKLAKAVKKRRK
jgi:hypothetical protein